MNDLEPNMGHIPVRDQGRRLEPSEQERLGRMHAELLAYQATIECRLIEEAPESLRPLIGFRFTEHIQIDDLWCANLWCRITPEQGLGWSMRPYRHDSALAVVYLTPCPDALSRDLARAWLASPTINPIRIATLGFREKHPSLRLHVRQI